MSKFLYPIYKLKTKSYIKWWLYHKKAGGSGILSEILEGFSFNLENTLNRKFKLFEIECNSVQDGTPSPDNEVPILSSGDNGSINEKITNSDGTKDQDYSIFVQQPFRSIGDVRDLFFKNTVDSPYYDENLTLNGWYERHYIGEVVLNGTEEIYLYNDNGNRAVFYIDVSDLYDYTNSAEAPELLSNRFRPTSQQATWVPGEISCRIGGRAIFFIFETGTTINDFKNWLSTHNVVVQYLLAEPLDLPCTEEQIQQLENKPSTYKDFTIINSQDETPAYLEVSGIRDINTMFDKVTNAIVSLGGNV